MNKKEEMSLKERFEQEAYEQEYYECLGIDNPKWVKAKKKSHEHEIQKQRTNA